MVEKSQNLEISQLNEEFNEGKPPSFEPTEIKELFDELGKNSEEDKMISSLFYNSVKMFFDIGFDLAKSLNFELLEDSVKKAIEQKED